MLKRYADLGHVYRNEPCQEYPGEWLVHVGGQDETSHASFEAAYEQAKEEFQDDWNGLGSIVSISWKCSKDDPRVGEQWFTEFYQHGKFNAYGRYVR